jgi:kumamolisin
LAGIYGFPTGVTGNGQRIAILEFKGGYQDSDLQTYFTNLNIPEPVITDVSIDGRQRGSVINEVTLDIEVAGAVAPGAAIDVYFIPNNSQSYLNALHTAIIDSANKPSIISISWALAEDSYTAMLDEFNELFKTAGSFNITICASSGDEGSDAGLGDGAAHVYFPACCPYVLGCGGTTLLTDNNNQVTSESVWNESNGSASGGGVSAHFDKPDYQAAVNVPLTDAGFAGRGVPDIAGDADGQTGYQVVVNGRNIICGGTSATAPLMAGLIALSNEKRGINAGFVNTYMYNHPELCRDIRQGDNINTDSGKGYAAGPGWDACTGLGVPSILKSSD